MTAAFVTAAQVREYLNLEGTSGRYSDAIISSNIRAASAFLERQTGRQFEPQTGVTKYFTSHGSAALKIPDLRTATSVVQQGVALDADDTFWLIPDNRGVYTTLQFRAYGAGGSASYLSNPQWFDRNLDRDFYRYGYTSLPNDLAITGDWGWDPLPEELLHATKVLAAWYVKRPASVLANVAVTPEGTELRYTSLPPEVTDFIASWKLGTTLVAI